MSEHHILLSPSASARLGEADKWLDPLLNRGEILILCAHLESADQFVRKLAEVHGAVHGIRRLTLDTLAYQLALPVLGEKGISPQSRLAEEAIAARVVQQCLDSGQLGPYESVAHWPGFARALTATFRELRLHEIVPQELTAKATPLMVALGQLLEQFEATSLGAGVADRAQVFETARRVVEYRENPPVGIPTLLLDVVLNTPSEQKLVAALARKSPRILATAPAGDEQTRAALEQILGCSPEATRRIPLNRDRFSSFNVSCLVNRLLQHPYLRHPTPKLGFSLHQEKLKKRSNLRDKSTRRPTEVSPSTPLLFCCAHQRSTHHSWKTRWPAQASRRILRTEFLARIPLDGPFCL